MRNFFIYMKKQQIPAMSACSLPLSALLIPGKNKKQKTYVWLYYFSIW